MEIFLPVNHSNGKEEWFFGLIGILRQGRFNQHIGTIMDYIQWFISDMTMIQYIFFTELGDADDRIGPVDQSLQVLEVFLFFGR